MSPGAPKAASSPHETLDVDEVLEEDPDDLIERGDAVGRARLARSTLDITITGVIGGVEVSLGGLAAATVLGAVLEAAPGAHLYGALALAAIVFPIGFLLVILGRSELFTENFLIPVVAVVRGDGRLRDLVRTWAASWVGNMAGCVALAALMSVPEAIGAPIVAGYTAYADYKLNLPALAVFVSAVLAGLVMTVLTWLMLAVRSVVGKVLVIWAVGFVIFASNAAHTVVGAALLFVGYSHTGHSWFEVAGWIGLSTAGNLVGGVGLVTVFRLVQTNEKQRSRGRRSPRR